MAMSASLLISTMYPEDIKFKGVFVPLGAILGVIVMWLLSYALIQGYNENGRSVLALLCVTLLHFIIVPVALFFMGMIFKPPLSTLSPDGVEVKIFPRRTSFYKWSDIGGELSISRMPGWPKAFCFHFIAVGQFHNEVYLVPISIFSKRSKVLEIVKSYRETALKANAIE